MASPIPVADAVIFSDDCSFTHHCSLNKSQSVSLQTHICTTVSLSAHIVRHLLPYQHRFKANQSRRLHVIVSHLIVCLLCESVKDLMVYLIF